MAGELRGIKESLYPIMSQLANAERQVLKTSSGYDEVNKLFQSIQASLQGMVNVFDPLKKLEGKLEKYLQELARQIDTMVKKIPETVETGLTEHLLGIERQAGKILENMKQHLEEGFRPPELKPVKVTEDRPAERTSSSLNAGLDNGKQRRESDKDLEEKKRLIGETIFDLDLQVKHCFFCLGVFPENSVIKKRLLIYLWIGMGIVVPDGESTAEKVAEKCFNELVSKGLVQAIYKKHRHFVDSCSMDSTTREVMISEGEKRHVFLSETKTNKILEEIISEPAVLTKGSLRMVRYSRDDTLALVNINEQYLQFQSNADQADPNEPVKMENFTVMQLGSWDSLVEKAPHIEMENIEFLKNLNKNKLGYLSLHGISRITELPSTVEKLSSLIILDLRACHNLERLPARMSSLKKLTHLDVSNCYLLDHLPRDIPSLSNLQVIKGFVMGNSSSKDPCKLSDLAKLGKLRKLSITVGPESVHMKEFEKLKDFGALRSLTITWGVVAPQSVNGDSDHEKKEPDLAAMTFPAQLEKLDIRAFPKTETPDWLLDPGLQNLQRVYIRGGKLVSFGARMNSRSVQVLRLRFLKHLQVEWNTLHQKFPSLEYLEVNEDCLKLREKFTELDNDGAWKKKKK